MTGVASPRKSYLDTAHSSRKRTVLHRPRRCRSAWYVQVSLCCSSSHVPALPCHLPIPSLPVAPLHHPTYLTLVAQAARLPTCPPPLRVRSSRRAQWLARRSPFWAAPPAAALLLSATQRAPAVAPPCPALPPPHRAPPVPCAAGLSTFCPGQALRRLTRRPPGRPFSHPDHPAHTQTHTLLHQPATRLGSL